MALRACKRLMPLHTEGGRIVIIVHRCEDMALAHQPLQVLHDIGCGPRGTASVVDVVAVHTQIFVGGVGDDLQNGGLQFIERRPITVRLHGTGGGGAGGGRGHRALHGGGHRGIGVHWRQWAPGIVQMDPDHLQVVVCDLIKGLDGFDAECHNVQALLPLPEVPVHADVGTGILRILGLRHACVVTLQPHLHVHNARAIVDLVGHVGIVAGVICQHFANECDLHEGLAIHAEHFIRALLGTPQHFDGDGRQRLLVCSAESLLRRGLISAGGGEEPTLACGRGEVVGIRVPRHCV
mmetsp:Transcript_1404/g.2530  ORF Transcript_1404/g.2530 Transcript_1404/m.2530 type:complete len:294 (+) Transcript_1404:649-1530(+)